jgi:hypothetical protein
VRFGRISCLQVIAVGGDSDYSELGGLATQANAAA